MYKSVYAFYRMKTRQSANSYEPPGKNTLIERSDVNPWVDHSAFLTRKVANTLLIPVTQKSARKNDIIGKPAQELLQAVVSRGF